MVTIIKNATKEIEIELVCTAYCYGKSTVLVLKYHDFAVDLEIEAVKALLEMSVGSATDWKIKKEYKNYRYIDDDGSYCQKRRLSYLIIGSLTIVLSEYYSDRREDEISQYITDLYYN